MKFIKKALVVFMLMLAFTPLVASGRVEAKSYSLGANEIQATDITDSVLLATLREQANKTNAGTLRVTTFTNYVMLDLSMSTPNSDRKISSLNGLTMFDLTGVKVLKLSNNSLSSITADTFKYMPNLEALYADNCNISSIDLSQCLKLRYVDLSNNKLSNVKLNKMIVDNTLEFVYDSSVSYDVATRDYVWNDSVTTITYANLSNNGIVSIANINFPEDKDGCVVDLYNNSITDYASNFDNIQVNLGLQGMSQSSILSEKVDDETKYYTTKSHSLYYLPTANDDLTFELTRTYKENGEDKNETVLINNSNYAQGQIIHLDLGEYTFKVYKNDVENYTDSVSKYYSKLSFSVIPSTPTFKYVVKGVEYDYLSVIDKVTTIKFSADEGAEIYYMFSTDSDWIKGNSVTINKGGKQFLYVKAVMNGYESKSMHIFVNASVNLHMPSLLILFLVIAGIIVLGFVIVPLIRKYIIKS